jgi:hypothetical protein
VATISAAANVMTSARKPLTIVIRVYGSLRGLATGVDFLGRGVEVGRGFYRGGFSKKYRAGAGCASAISGSPIGESVVSGAS